MCEKSDSIKELATALCKAQSEIKPAEMNSINPFLKNKYADLGSVIKAVAPALKANNLSYSQLVTGDDGKIGVTTILMHTSGEWIQSTMMMRLASDKGLSMAQSAGAIISYLRRYSLSALLGVYADEENDSNEEKSGKKISPPKKVDQQPMEKMSLEMAENLIGGSDSKRYGDLTVEELSHRYNGIVGALKTEKDEKRIEELQIKRDGIEVLLKHRKENK